MSATYYEAGPMIPAELVSSFVKAESVAVLTGAGISAESGVPTFREAQKGLWSQYDPQELATPEAFRCNPELVWQWYSWRRELIAGAEPNAGHRALSELENHVPKLTLITQNVDGLHRQAGSTSVIELHGNIARTICSQEGMVIDAWPEREELPPKCPRCGGLLRPDVVWFGESLPAEAVALALEASRRCDLFLSVGTSALVQPAASLPFEARHHGATLVEVNVEETPLTAFADYQLKGQAGRVIPLLLNEITIARNPK